MLIRFISRLLLLALLSLASVFTNASESTRIAAAADLRFAMDAVLAIYRASYPEHKMEVVYGSSGRFHAQIEHGAPFDLYFSADIAYPQALKNSGHAAGEVINYALGRIVIWSHKHDATQLTLEKLAEPSFRHIAIANPRHAPYGARAKEAFESLKLWEAIEPKLVYGENISHSMQMVQSGAADAGIVALSLVLNPTVVKQGAYYLIDDALHLPLNQAFIVTKRAADNNIAHHFAAYMMSKEARRIMRSYGFVLADEEKELL